MKSRLTLTLAEEVEDAGRTLPRAMMWAVYINGAVGFIMAVTMCFCLGDLSKVVDTPTGYPFIQVFYNATNSYAATNIMVTIMIITLTACCISEVATSSRQLWSFARDKGIPFSNWFAYVIYAFRIDFYLSANIRPGFPYTARTSSCNHRFDDHHLCRILD